jgi:hypothetical protein
LVPVFRYDRFMFRLCSDCQQKLSPFVLLSSPGASIVVISCWKWLGNVAMGRRVAGVSGMGQGRCRGKSTREALIPVPQRT